MPRFNLLEGTYPRANRSRWERTNALLGSTWAESLESWLAVGRPGDALSTPGSSWPLAWWQVPGRLHRALWSTDGPDRRQPRLNLLAPRHALVRAGHLSTWGDDGAARDTARWRFERSLAARVAEAAGLDHSLRWE
jgi:hypothetical protein